MKLDPDAALLRIRKIAWGAVALFSCIGALFGMPHFIGVVSGGLLAMVGFDALSRLVSRLTGERPGSIAWLGVMGLLFRYILLSIALFVIIRVWHANVVALAVGFSAPVAAVFVECGLYMYQELKSGA